jgi:hypothetical protein
MYVKRAYQKINVFISWFCIDVQHAVDLVYVDIEEKVESVLLAGALEYVNIRDKNINVSNAASREGQRVGLKRREKKDRARP